MLTKSLEHLFEGVGRLSLAVVQENLEKTRDADLAIKAMEITRKGLGLGVMNQGVTVNNFVAVVPPKAASYDEWARQHRPGYNPPPALEHEGGTVPEVVVAEKIEQEL